MSDSESVTVFLPVMCLLRRGAPPLVCLVVGLALVDLVRKSATSLSVLWPSVAVDVAFFFAAAAFLAAAFLAAAAVAALTVAAAAS